MSGLDETTLAPDPNAGLAIPGETGPDGTTGLAADPGPAGAGGDTEQRARAMGWVPQDEFRGAPEKWRSADEFVRVGENELPVLRENLQRTTRTIVELQNRLSARDAEVARIARMTEVALARQRDQLAVNYEAAKRQAAAEGDITRYDQLSRDGKEAIHHQDQQVREVMAPPDPRQGPRLTPEQERDVQGWIANNASWFNRDPVMTATATAVSHQIDQAMPGLTLKENLDRTRAEVARRFPEKFGRAPAQSQSMAGYAPVEGGQRMATNGAPRRRGANELPADAKAQGERFVRQGYFKDLADYAADYWAQEA